MENLPVETIFKILDYTSSSDFYALKKTCRYFRNCVTTYLAYLKQEDSEYGPSTKSFDDNLTQYYFKNLLHSPSISYSGEDVIQFYNDGLKCGPSVIIDFNEETLDICDAHNIYNIHNTYLFKLDKVCVYKDSKLVDTFVWKSRNNKISPNLLLLWLYLRRTNLNLIC